MPSLRRNARRAVALVTLLGVWVAAPACGPGARAPAKGPALPALVIEPLQDAARSTRGSVLPGPVASHLVGRIARKSIGPFLARTKDEGIAVWITTSEHGAGAELVSVPLSADGAPLGEPRAVASAPREATSLVVRPTGRNRKGWMVMWSGLLDRGESVALLELGPDGAARAAPTDLQRTDDHVTWIDLVPTPSGALSVWAEETTAGAANILTAVVDSSGKAQGRPVRVARGVHGWAVAQGDGAVALALVTREKGAAAGTLSWLRLDAQGRGTAPPVAIGNAPTVSGEVDMIAIADAWLLAWTDRTREDAQVVMATVDAVGQVHGPVPAMNALGGSALVRMASGPAGVVLAWEDPHGRARPSHSLHLASVSPAPVPAARPVTSLEVTRQMSPELLALDDGFALLASAPACSRPGQAEPCPRAFVSTFLRLDAHLAPAQAEPLFVGESRGPAALAWALQCAGSSCFALAAGSETPTPIFTVDLSPRASPFAAPVIAPPPPGAPRAAALVTVASGQPYIDLAAARAGDTTLVATLITTADRSGPQRRRQGASIAVRPFDDQGQPLGASASLSSSALPVGRVAIAAAPDQAGAVAAWVTLDAGDPQVHLARLDRGGHVIKTTQLTTAKGDASDVALAWAGDGWLVAWVDARDGNGEVYAAKVGRELDHIGPGQRVTRSPGDAADVALVVRGDTAWLAWSDPREGPAEGLSDIYVATLHARDATRSGEEVRVLATAAHSRSPALAATGDGALVGWIEDAPTGVDASGAAMLARLDAAGHVVGTPGAIALAGEGRPTAMALTATAHGARAVVARAWHDEIVLDAVSFGADGAARAEAWPLIDLDAPASFDVALAFAGDALYYDDSGRAPDDHRIRRAAIDWR